MRDVLPNACFIAFTGMPIAKKEKSTFAKFGDLVQRAVAVCPDVPRLDTGH